MPDVPVRITAVVEHRKASSECCGALLRLPPEGAEHEYECTACGQPAVGEPRHVPAVGTLAGGEG